MAGPNIPGLNTTTDADQNDFLGRIPGNSLNLTRIGTVGSAAAAIVATVAPILKPASGDPLPIQVVYASSKGVVVVAALVVIGWLIVADVRARSLVAASPNRHSLVFTLPQLLAVRIIDEGSGNAVALRTNADGSIDFLITQPGHRPKWTPQTNIELPEGMTPPGTNPRPRSHQR